MHPLDVFQVSRPVLNDSDGCENSSRLAHLVGPKSITKEVLTNRKGEQNALRLSQRRANLGASESSSLKERTSSSAPDFRSEHSRGIRGIHKCKCTRLEARASRFGRI